MDETTWRELRDITPEKMAVARLILEDVRRGEDVLRAALQHPLPGSGGCAKHVLVAAYRQLVASGEWPPDPALLARIRMKPVRTLSGVTTVTVLTKPYPCPGKCIFCPTMCACPRATCPTNRARCARLAERF